MKQVRRTAGTQGGARRPGAFKRARSARSTLKRSLGVLRYATLPAILLLVFLAQLQWPQIHQTGALWSDRLRWWQFFTCNFLSGNWIHLLFNMLSMTVLHSQFGPRVRVGILLLLFALFSVIATGLYVLFFIPPRVWLVGASGGIYALFGFFGWFQRRGRVGLLGLRRLSIPFLVALPLLIGIEALVAYFWIPRLAWPMHAVGMVSGVVAALGLQMVCSLCHQLTAFQNIIQTLELREPVLAME